jgi:hypothetical protein
MEEYVIACNNQNDEVFRKGALCYLIGGQNGDGFEKRIFTGLGRNGKPITKWSSTKYFTNYRAKWKKPTMQVVPLTGDDKISPYLFTKEDAIAFASAIAQYLQMTSNFQLVLPCSYLQIDAAAQLKN